VRWVLGKKAQGDRSCLYSFWGKTNPRSSCVYVSRVEQIPVSDQCAPGLGVKCGRATSFHDSFHDAKLKTVFLISAESGHVHLWSISRTIGATSSSQRTNLPNPATDLPPFDRNNTFDGHHITNL